MQDYDDGPDMGPEEDDMIDNAAEPTVQDQQNNEAPAQAVEKITTKFLTKYERGRLTSLVFIQFHACM